jgi:hypothetical protein
MGCGCGKRGTTTSFAGAARTPATIPADRSTPAARRGVTAAARVSYVVSKPGGERGRKFSTLSAAQDYARATGGTVATA